MQPRRPTGPPEYLVSALVSCYDAWEWVLSHSASLGAEQHTRARQVLQDDWRSIGTALAPYSAAALMAAIQARSRGDLLAVGVIGDLRTGVLPGELRMPPIEL